MTGLSWVAGQFLGEGVIAFGAGMLDEMIEEETEAMSADAKKDLKKRRKEFVA